MFETTNLNSRKKYKRDAIKANELDTTNSTAVF